MIMLSRIIFTLFLLGSFSQSQSQSVAALQQQLTSAQGTHRVDILNTLTEQLNFSQPAQAIAFVNEA
jgi:hypothetical protein